MRYSKLMLAAVLGALGIQMAGATPTAEEVAQLGKTLTPFGAIKAGNKEGTIPEWTGGVCTPPPGYKPMKGLDVGGGPYVDPFAADKPLYKITAADVEKYADKIDEGTKKLFRTYPTFYILVYPTRRSACFPNWAYENTIKRVMSPKIVGGNVPSLAGAHAQVPFPIPKSGVEVMWDVATRMSAPAITYTVASYLVDASGHVTGVNAGITWLETPYWDNSVTSLPDDVPLWAGRNRNYAPASLVGQMIMLYEFLRPDLKGAPAWSYIPGQRRVRLAPEFAYDGVVTPTGGVPLYDENFGFDGKMDKFDFKLVGRQEMYVPYNTYEFHNAPDLDVVKPNHIDPASLRFELHRVWVVEATLKPGERHVQKKKVFYVDEDTWNIATYNAFDHGDKIAKLNYQVGIQFYDHPVYRNNVMILYDFSKRAYVVQTKISGQGFAGMNYGFLKEKSFPPNFFTPEAMAGMGLR